MSSSFQLYSARNHGPLDNTLAMLSAMGYTRVEGYGGLFGDVDALQRSLADHGLVMPTSHIGLDVLESDFAGALAIIKQLGIELVFAPYLDAESRPVDAAGWRALAARLARVGERLGDLGVTFGWHNHDFELVPLPDGSIPLYELLDHAPDLLWQGDLAWVQRAGADPLAVLDRYASRVASIHVKDIAREGECVDEDGWADPGEGVMEWDRLLQRIGDYQQEVITVVEHDKPSDAERFARRALAFMNAAKASS